jgi:dienelactone hydrolase
MRVSVCALTLVALVISSPSFAQLHGPQGSESGPLREQEWLIPGPGGALMDATVFRPHGQARAPLVVVNHGSPLDAGERLLMTRPRLLPISSYFVSRGYVVVLPLRRGYGATGGHWAETYGGCDRPDYLGAGLATAADIAATIDFMRGQPFVAAERTIVVGQSAGGWGTLALSSRNPRGVPGMIDFAGGRGGQQTEQGGGCEPTALVWAASRYGATARVPLLWITTANDSFFEPALVARMVAAYNGAGGRALHRALGAFANDGHSLAISEAGAPIWEPLVGDFLKGK